MKRVSLVALVVLALVGPAACSTDSPLVPAPDQPLLDCGPGTYGSGHVCTTSSGATATTSSDSTGRGPGTYGSGH
jgi:hypothetical protein